ncbi:uncharacterized protein LOC62_03G004421 [Vanrija pseudolonga]|uniref:Uncharacterized protein n=1 Tax=Vanrija pseudolonga TaxID=143232 RepID=A0AAF1BQF7_9TREE|nr:hypothetical protein LOC62_03G004421 [Vanrija pseudolonga]
MSRRPLGPLLVAMGVGIISGIYIWDTPLKQETGRLPPPEPIVPPPSEAGVKGEQSPAAPAPVAPGTEKPAAAEPTPSPKAADAPAKRRTEEKKDEPKRDV